MGRKKKEHAVLKTRVSVRLENHVIETIKEKGSLQEIIEKSVIQYLEKEKKMS